MNHAELSTVRPGDAVVINGKHVITMIDPRPRGVGRYPQTVKTSSPYGLEDPAWVHPSRLSFPKS